MRISGLRVMFTIYRYHFFVWSTQDLPVFSPCRPINSETLLLSISYLNKIQQDWWLH